MRQSWLLEMGLRFFRELSDHGGFTALLPVRRRAECRIRPVVAAVSARKMPRSSALEVAEVNRSGSREESVWHARRNTDMRLEPFFCRQYLASKNYPVVYERRLTWIILG